MVGGSASLWFLWFGRDHRLPRPGALDLPRQSLDTRRQRSEGTATHVPRIRIGNAQGVLDAVAKRGGSVERVLRAAGLRASDISDPDRFAELEKMLVLQDAAARE